MLEGLQLVSSWEVVVRREVYLKLRESCSTGCGRVWLLTSMVAWGGWWVFGGRGMFYVCPHGSVHPGIIFCVDIVLFADEILQKQVQYFIMLNSFFNVSVTLE